MFKLRAEHFMGRTKSEGQKCENCFWRMSSQKMYRFTWNTTSTTPIPSCTFYPMQCSSENAYFLRQTGRQYSKQWHAETCTESCHTCVDISLWGRAIHLQQYTATGTLGRISHSFFNICWLFCYFISWSRISSLYNTSEQSLVYSLAINRLHTPWLISVLVWGRQLNIN